MTNELEDMTERLGRLVDTIDNYLVYGEPQPFPVQIRLDALKHGLEEARVGVLQIYLDLGGEDVWS